MFLDIFILNTENAFSFEAKNVKENEPSKILLIYY